MDYSNIIDRLHFIKGHIIADDKREALQQLKELLQIIEELELLDLENKNKLNERIKPI